MCQVKTSERAVTVREHRAPSTDGPWLKRVSLSDMRCYAAADIALAPGMVALTGPNGAGKTNLLEAISLLGPGRGLRSVKLGEIVRRGSETGRWAVAARLMRGDDVLSVGVGIEPNARGAERRVVRIDGRTAQSPQALLEHLAVLWVTPAQDRLFTEAASERRQFFDRLVATLAPAHATHVAAFERLARQRLRVLTGADGASRAGTWLDAIEADMAAHGVAIAAGRLGALDRLAAVIAAGTVDPDLFPRAELALSGAVEASLRDRSALEVEDALARTFAESRQRDGEAGRTLKGPMRSDLEVTFALKGMPAAASSTGEQKALLLGIVLAHAELVRRHRRGEAPLLLLDEVAAHLDVSRRKGLFEAIGRLGGQTFMTGTDIELFAGVDGAIHHLRVDGGTVVSG